MQSAVTKIENLITKSTRNLELSFTKVLSGKSTPRKSSPRPGQQ